MKPLILLSTIFLALNLQASIVGGVAILIKDKAVTLYDIQKLMSQEHLNANEASEILIRKILEENEIDERKINVTNQEVYDQIQMMAKQNNMSISQLYEAMFKVRKLTQQELKDKIKENKLKEKLYNAIAFSNLEQPSAEDEQTYYDLHIDKYTRPESFSIVIYTSKNRVSLENKITNPMLYTPDVSNKAETMYYDKINPRLAELLNQTKIGAFTPIVPSPEDGYMSFYVSDKMNNKAQSIDKVRREIGNAIMEDIKNQVLNDYFARLRLNADIQILRLPN